MALTQNPQLEALAAQTQALEHKTTLAGAWKDPRLTIAYQNVPVDSLALGQEPMSMLRIQLGQTIPFPGKTARRQSVVRHATETSRWALQERRNQLRAAVKQAYYKLTLTRQLRRLTEAHVVLVVQLLDVVRIKYEVGRAPQENLLRLEVLRDQLKDDLHDFDRRAEQLTAALNASLHRSAATPIATPEELQGGTPAQDATMLHQVALQERPALKGLAADAAMHGAAAGLARYEAIPDPTVFAAYGLRTAIANGPPGRDLITLGVSLPLPVFFGSRYAARALESGSQERASRARREAMVDDIAASLVDAMSRWRRAAAKVETYRGNLVPAAHRTLDALFAAYRVDRADFLSLFEAQLQLLNFEKTIRIATVDALLARTTAEMLSGKEL